MNVWLPVIANLAVSLIIGAFVYGRLTQSVSNQERRLNEVESDQGSLWRTISNHGERIASLEGKSE